MSDQLWLGVPAVDGARVGPLRLKVNCLDPREVCVMCRSWDDSWGVAVGWTWFAHVDTRTRQWLASLSALVPETRELLEAGERLRADATPGTSAAMAYDAAKGRAGR